MRVRQRAVNMWGGLCPPNLSRRAMPALLPQQVAWMQARSAGIRVCRPTTVPDCATAWLHPGYTGFGTSMEIARPRIQCAQQPCPVVQAFGDEVLYAVAF